MTVQEVISILEDDAVAQDIIYGNSPRDMIIRAKKNVAIKIAKAYLDHNRINIEFVLNAVKTRLAVAPDNAIYHLGTLIAYFEVLSFFPGQGVRDIFLQVISELPPDNLFRQAVIAMFDSMPESSPTGADITSKLQTTTPSTFVIETQAMTFKIGFN